MNAPSQGEGAVKARAQHWIARLAAQDITGPELDELNDWLAAAPEHARAFARERALWQDIGVLADAMEAPVAERGVARARLLPFIPRPRMARAIPIAIAASLAAIWAIPAIMIDLRADYRTVHGEQASFDLPDGSTAMLDSDTALAIDFDGDDRIVTVLTGRAWFNVRHHQRPFLVEAMGGITRDIGTAFEIRRENGRVDVAVTQGAVEVSAPDGRSVRELHAGERARYGGKGLQALASQPAETLASWRKGELILDKQPVENALAEISRYRDGAVWTIGDFGGTAPVSGLFLVDRPEEALETIVRMRGLQATKLPGGLVIVRPARSE